MNPILREIYDVSRDKIFRDEFKKYVTEQKYVATRWFVNFEWTYQFEHPDDSLTSAEYRRVVDEVIRAIETDLTRLYGWLIQFWRAEEERVVNNNSVGERRFLLTLRNQPFLFRGFYLDGLYRYRPKMHDVIVNGDGTGGPIGRVFQNNRMEYTPNVSFYSDNEYPQPQRDIAKSCGVGSSLVLPWRDCNGGVVGAIEFVTLLGLPLLRRFPSNILHSNSCYSDYCQRLCGQYDSEKDSLISAVTEINEVIEEVCERRDVVRCAQIWMLCKHCNSLCTIKRCVGEQKALSENFIDRPAGSIFLIYQDYYKLKKGEGVVGKAAESSHDLAYCEDVAKFSITEYPLAHFARDFGLSASFAIRLKSNQTGDRVYVLEFFLHPDYVKGRNLMAILVPILEKMRQCFKTFKFASGEEKKESFSVKVIDAHSPDKVETLRNEKLDLTLTVGSYKASDFRHNMERFGRRGESSRPAFLQSSIGESSTEETDDLMTIVETLLQNISMEDSPISSASTVQCEIRVTIKATYGVDSISFQLSASSGIYELYRQVCQRLQLADTTFDLKYLDDDNDLIELTCDEDLQLYISSSMEQENYNLLVFVVPRYSL